MNQSYITKIMKIKLEKNNKLNLKINGSRRTKITIKMKWKKNKNMTMFLAFKV